MTINVYFKETMPGCWSFKHFSNIAPWWNVVHVRISPLWMLCCYYCGFKYKQKKKLQVLLQNQIKIISSLENATFYYI